jgi:hypothetical protein
MGVVVELKDGRRFCGPLWCWRPLEGWFSITDDVSGDLVEVKLDETKSAVDKAVRVGKKRDENGNVVGPLLEDVDLLQRAEKAIKEQEERDSYVSEHRRQT